jgi:hypothetical protein
MVVTLVYLPMELDPQISPMPVIHFVLVANAWCKYVFFLFFLPHSGESLTPPQHVSVYMRQYCSHISACCQIIRLQCALSDSVLAWRCYVFFGKRRWLKWTLTIVVLVVTGKCCMNL